MYYYTYNTHILAAAGIVGILVIAVVLTALLAVLGIVYFFVTERLLRRHLNLE